MTSPLLHLLPARPIQWLGLCYSFFPAVRNGRLALALLVGALSSAPIVHGAESATAAPTAATHSQRITGTVQHGGTGQYIAGATVELTGTGRTVLTDSLGRFEFRDLAAGNYTVEVSYTGLDSQRIPVEVGAAVSTPLAIKLESEVLKLETYQVTTEKEGHAAAITRQRNSPNLITAAATDAFGALASQNPAEILMRLPGVAATVGQDNEPSAVSIRGMASNMNTVTTDGAPIAPIASNATRQVRFTTTSTSQYEEFEVVKGIRPDMEGSSLGGTINLKTRSPLLRTGPNEFSYKIGGRWAPPFAPHNPTRRDHPLQADTMLGYSGVFDVFGHKRNLAISVTGTYFESVGDYQQTLRDYEFTTNERAYVWDYRATDYYFNRKLRTLGGRVDYRLSDSTIVSLRLSDNHYDAWGGHLLNQVRAFTGRTVATVDANGNPTGTGAILPSYTTDHMEARPLAASGFSLLSNSVGQLQEQKNFQFVLEHKKDRLEANVNLNYAIGRISQMSGQHTGQSLGGSFTTTITGVGYKLDQANSEYPTFTQTAGPSIYDIANYKTPNLIQTGSRRDSTIYSAAANIKYELNTKFPTYLKTGAIFREQGSDLRTWDDRNLTYVGPDRIANTADDTLQPFLSKLVLSPQYNFGNLPLVDVKLLAKNLEDHPEQWSENLYYHEMRKLALTNKITEDVSAGYIMANTRIDRLNILTGARYERTDVESKAWVQTSTRTDITDPTLRAATEFSRRVIKGNYDNVLPSVHLSYSIKPNLITRFSYSTGMARPEYTNLVPTETVNTTAQTVSVSNASLLPQTGTNWDFSLEYYTKPMGAISIGLFEKDLEKFIFTSTNGIVGNGPDNGFGGQYAGYTINTQLNGGSARIRGLELSYQQQLNFGPRWVRSIGVFANYTRLTAQGDYGAGASQSVNRLAEFVPETWNAGVRFARGKFRASTLVNYTGDYLFAFSTDPSRLRYKNSFTTTTVSTSWALRSKLEVYLDAYNVFNRPQSYYYAVPSHLNEYSIKGMMVSFGVRGRF
jgi:iron complex outermembrane receptor protein